MKKFIATLLTAIALMALLAGCGGGGGGTSGGGNVVTMGNSTFGQTSITITKGSTITFKNDAPASSGSFHQLRNGSNGTVTQEPGAPTINSPDIQPGQSWTTPPFNSDGTFHIFCTIHPTTMNLTVTVTG
jgi:plastocyanin